MTLFALPVTLILGLTLSLEAFAQAPTPAATGSYVTKAPGPLGPRPVGRSEWKIPTIVEVASFLNWKTGARADAFEGLTLIEAAVRVDDSALAYIEGSNRQWVSPEIRKNLDYNLTASDVAVIKNRLRKFRVQMVAYRVDTLDPDDATRRKVLEFAKSLGVEMVVAPVEPAALPSVDKLANEAGINIAVEMPGDPKRMAASLKGLSNRMGVRVDTGVWTRDLPLIKDRLMAVNLGYGAPATGQLLREMYGLGIKPLWLTLNTSGALDVTADLKRAVDNFEQAVLPTLGTYMVQRSKLLTIRGAEELSPETKQKIEAAIPHNAPAKPLKPRRLLVMDEHSGHSPIPNLNYALEAMAKSTGAFEAVFSNDLDNLKYGKIRQFDAVMLNSTESDISSDPAVREGLLRFVREGGGLGGFHAASWSAAFWPEFMEMTGASQGPHKVQPATWKFDDPDSPITKAFGGQPFTYTDEYYRMTDTGLQGSYYSRDKVHVLISVDIEKSPGFNSGRVPFVRQDNDYPVAWIKGYGKGRVFFSCLGHTPGMFEDAKVEEFMLATAQFLLGDLAADTTPSSELPAR